MQPDSSLLVDLVVGSVPPARPRVIVFVVHDFAAGAGVLEVELFGAIVPAEQRVIRHPYELQRISEAAANGDRKRRQRRTRAGSLRAQYAVDKDLAAVCRPPGLPLWVVALTVSSYRTPN